jgi:hypothetical protein
VVPMGVVFVCTLYCEMETTSIFPIHSNRLATITASVV